MRLILLTGYKVYKDKYEDRREEEKISLGIVSPSEFPSAGTKAQLYQFC